MFKNRSIANIVSEKVMIVNPKIKKLYKDLSFHHPYIIDRIKI